MIGGQPDHGECPSTQSVAIAPIADLPAQGRIRGDIIVALPKDMPSHRELTLALFSRLPRAKRVALPRRKEL
jgi:hypothetical protein